MVQLTNVNKNYYLGENRLHVLKDINLEIKGGEFVAVLGASGSGKSTLMNIIGCMDNFDSGEFYLQGEAVHGVREQRLAGIRNRKIGFIFQKYHLIPQYNILQNVMMPLLIRGMGKKAAAKLAMEKIETVGLRERLDHRPQELSGGQQQRVAIARALVTEPALLLADEPTGALDSITSKEILGMFRELNGNGNTILMITHDETVASYAHRTVRLADGVMVS